MSPLCSRPMARLLHLEFSGAVYRVTSRGNARQDIVRDDRDRTYFLALLAHMSQVEISFRILEWEKGSVLVIRHEIYTLA